MSRLEGIITERMKKLEELKKKGINPYPSKFNKTKNIDEIISKHSKIKPGSETKINVKISGRLMVVRNIGKLIFTELQDYTGKMQIQLQDSITKDFELFKYIDSGDFIGIEGNVIKTKRGELTVLAKSFKLLSKAILPLPEKWHGLKDEEERFRKRYLDIILNPELKSLFIKKSLFWNIIRNFMIKKGFLEVETPVLENTPGGADAEPFITHHNSLDIDVYLRISMGELWQKKLMVAGFEKVFEIGRQFRNEGMSTEHLQDYTQMEFYWAYADHEDCMKLVEEMFKKIVKEVNGSYKFKYKNFNIDLSKKWKKIDYVSEIKKQTGIDFFSCTKDDIVKKLKELNIKHGKMDKERIIDSLWKYCRKNIQGPAFIVNHPVSISPLAKKNEKDDKKVNRFTVLIAGSELGNGYSELNDPLDQEERFNKQVKMREKGDKEAQMKDQEFIEALKYGMPPTCGFGMSERVFAFLMDKSVRECQLFPLMKPKK